MAFFILPLLSARYLDIGPEGRYQSRADALHVANYAFITHENSALFQKKYVIIKHRCVDADIARVVFPAVIITHIISPKLLRYMEIIYVILLVD